MGQDAGVLRKPGPFHSVENQTPEFPNFPIFEMLPAGQYSAQQNRRVDQGYLGIELPFRGIDVGPVIEEASMIGQLPPKKLQGI